MREKFPWWKLIAGFLFFIFFHQIYDILGGGSLAAILGEGIESIYAHMKMYFYAYLLVCLIDYVLRRKQIVSTDSFWYPRMLIQASFPWMSIAIWFIPIALGFELGRYELAYSFALSSWVCILGFVGRGPGRYKIPPGIEGHDLACVFRGIHYLHWIFFSRAR